MRNGDLGKRSSCQDDEKEYELIDGQQLSGGTTAKGLEKEEEEQLTTITNHNFFATSPSMKSQTSSSSLMVSKSLPTTWSDILNNDNNRFAANAIHLFPPLVSTSHKGSNGRIVIIGGSEKYCGAPYYAATAALRVGVDLVTVLCAQEASIPIKCYSPELIVQGIYSITDMDSLLYEKRRRY